MDIMTQLFKLDIPSFVIGFFIILSSAVAMNDIIGRFSKIIGGPVKWVRKKESDHDLLIVTIDEMQTIKEDLSALTEIVNNITSILNEMRAKENETKLKELKGSLVRYYNKYKNAGEWSKIEKDAFWDLFDDYEKRGGDGYIHTIVEPAMRELKEIDSSEIR